MAARSASPARRITFLAAVAAALLAPLAGLAEPESHVRLRPIERWIPLVDDPATADSAYAGLMQAMPSLADSFTRGFAWYLVYSAAQAKGHVDTMHAAAESAYALKPSDPSVLREFGTWLGRQRLRLDLAESLMRRTVAIVERDPAMGSLVGDLGWLGEIQSRRGNDDAAVATWERCAREAKGTYAYVLFELSDAYAKRGDADRAVANLAAGLAIFPRDSANLGEAWGKLDSLAGVRRLSRDSLYAAIDEGYARSQRKRMLDDYRADQAAPRTRLVDMATGQPRRPDFTHGLTLVYFWATWCGPCRHALPVLQDWAKLPRTRPVRVIAVNVEGEAPRASLPAVRAFAREHGLALPVMLADTTTATRWGVEGFPSTRVIRDGRILYRGHGGGLVEGLEAQLESLGSRRVVR